MADIFISYARADRAKIEKLAAALEDEGFSVWWDRNVHAGARFAEEIARELEEAKAVVAAWSQEALHSEWVLDEAAQARDDNKLIPVTLDHEKPPLGFRQRQAIDFSDWNGDRSAPTFIELVAALKHYETRETVTPAPLKIEPHRLSGKTTAFIAAGAAALAIVAGVTFISLRPAPEETAADATAPEEKSQSVGLAVIPFVNMSADPEQEYFADGLSEELLNWLANVEGLHVPGRTASFQFKDQAGDFAEIGRRLGVEYLLEGSVRRSGDELRITAQLIKADTGYHLWSDTYDRKLDDIFAIQDDVAQKVVTELLGRIPESGMENPALAGDVDPRAHELYLQARALLTMRRNPEAFKKFREAVAIDPNHALAQAYVASIAVNALHNGYNPGVEDGDVRGVMNDAITRAVKLRPDSADVLFAQGKVLELGGENSSHAPQRAIEFYERAIRANPRHAEALHTLAANENDTGKYIKLLEEVIAIEPGHIAARANLTRIYLREGKVDEAMKLTEETFTLLPDTPYAYTSDTFLEAGLQEYAYDFMFRNWNAENLRERQWRRRALELANMGAREEGAAIFQMIAAQAGDAATRHWLKSSAAVLTGDIDTQVEEARLIYEGPNAPFWAAGLYAKALTYAGEYDRAVEIMQLRNPSLFSDNPQPRFDSAGNLSDSDAYIAATALALSGRKEDADRIWKAAAENLELNPATYGWTIDMARALIFVHIGDGREGIEALYKAYDEGFRFLYNFDCIGCADGDFYNPNGFFAPVYDTPEFRALVEKIEADNRAMRDIMQARHGVLTHARAMMAEAEEAAGAN